MILILEIILTIVAWTRGWKVQALIPVATVFGIGLIIGAAGLATPSVLGVLIIFDIVCLIVLLVMSIKGKSVQSK